MTGTISVYLRTWKLKKKSNSAPLCTVGKSILRAAHLENETRLAYRVVGEEIVISKEKA